MGCTKLSSKSLADSLARVEYLGFVSMSVRVVASVSFVSFAKGRVRPFPFCSDLNELRRWSAKNGMNSIGTPRAIPSYVPDIPENCQIHNKMGIGFCRK